LVPNFKNLRSQGIIRKLETFIYKYLKGGHQDTRRTDASKTACELRARSAGFYSQAVSQYIHIIAVQWGCCTVFVCFSFPALGIKRINIRKDVSAFYTCGVCLTVHFKRRQLTHVGVAF